MPKDTSVLNIQWRYLSYDEQGNDKCRTTVEMFALCRNRPSTYGTLQKYYYDIKQPPKRLTPDSDQKGPIRHYVQEWNRVAGESKVGCHPLNEDGCSFEELAPGSGRSKPHRVCQKHVGPGRTVEHWVNRRLASKLFPFLANPNLWVEPPIIQAISRKSKKSSADGENATSSSTLEGTTRSAPIIVEEAHTFPSPSRSPYENYLTSNVPSTLTWDMLLARGRSTCITHLSKW